MKVRFPLITLLVLCSINLLYAQPVLQWSKNFGGSRNDSAYAVKQTADGGYIVVGQSSSVDGDVSGNHGGIDYWVVKLDAAGTRIWQRSYGGSGTDIAKAVVQTSDGGYIIAGVSNSKNGDVTDYGQSHHYGIPPDDYDIPTNIYEPWIVKINSAGSITWKKSLHRTRAVGADLYYFENIANTIIQTADGGYLVGGIGPDWTSTGFPDYTTYQTSGAMLVKLTSTGLVSWTKIFSQLIVEIGDYPWEVTSMVQVGSGYTVAGHGFRYGEYNYDIYILNVTANGDYVWERSYGSITGFDYASSIQRTTDGGYIVAGTAAGPDGDFAGTGYHGGIYEPTDFCLLKLNSTGMLTWARCYGGFDEEEARSVQQTADGGYLVAGYARSSDGQVTGHSLGNSDDYWIVEVTGAGTFTWGKIFGGTGMDDAMSLEKCSDGGFIVAGLSTSTNAGFVTNGLADYWLIKFQLCGFIGSPAVTPTQTFCSGARVANLRATGGVGATLKWYTVSFGGIALTPATLLTSRRYYVSQTFGFCEGTRGSVDVIINPTPLVPISFNQTFCATDNPTVTNLAALISPGSTARWYNVATGGLPLAPTTPLVSGNYYVSQISGSCESARLFIGVVVTVTTRANVITTQRFCAGTSPTVANLVVLAGYNIRWYRVATGGTALPPATRLETGNYYVSSTVGGCESMRRLVAVTVIPSTAPTASNQTFCATSNPVVGNLIVTGAAGATFKWYNVSSGGTALNAATPLVNGTYYVSQTIGTCESVRRAITVTLTVTTRANVATTQNFCASASPTVANLVVLVGYNIRWYTVSSGGTALPPTTPLVTGNYFVSSTVAGCESLRRLVAVGVVACVASRGQEIGGTKANTTVVNSLYPNPASSTVTVNIKSVNTISDAKIILVDMQGKILLQQTVANNHGSIRKIIDVSKLSNGVYTVKYIIGKEIGEMKLVVAR